MMELAHLEQSLLTNPAPRCPCMLLLDTSGSMQGRPIAELGDGVGQFIVELQGDEVAASSVELGIISFGGQVQELQPLASVAEFDSRPALVADGVTPLGEAIALGIERLAQRKQAYQQAGVSYYQPWMVIMSDGVPTDSGWPVRAAELRALAQAKKMVVLCVAIGAEADIGELSRCALLPPKRLAGLRFTEFFMWLSQSMQRVSASIPGDKVQLPATSGWDSIDV
ncbi:vWA domain-containing protein [Aeromonas sp. 97A]|uniref:vWA domain-containing protein n=1 Tax=Aeromonas sp. 97A TaxID=3452731 RepID=UPI003F798E37